MSNQLQLHTAPYTTTLIGLKIARQSTLKEWRDFGSILSKVDQAKQWAIGDWLVDGKSHYGDGIYKEAAKLLGLDYGTLRNYKSLCETFKLSFRNDKVSHSHHAQVASIKSLEEKNDKLQFSKQSDMEKMQEFLTIAEKSNWTVKELRDEVVTYQNDQKRIQALANQPKKYQVIYADPPWEYDTANPQCGPVGNASKTYRTMKINDICLMPIKQIAADNSILFLWVPVNMARKAFLVIDAWGFEYKTGMVWIKTDLTTPGAGYYIRINHELLFLATRGNFTPLDRQISPPIRSIIEAPRGKKHSQKPEIVYEIIEKMYPGVRYLELFARSERKDWVVWGDEVNNVYN